MSAVPERTKMTMALRMQDQISRLREHLRYEPTAKRIRGEALGDLIVDSRRTVLVWEAGTLVPVYAVPAADITAELLPVAAENSRRGSAFHRGHGAGQEFTLRTPGGELPAAAFVADDPELSAYVLLEYGAFDRWREDEEPVDGHPRDPFHRVDARASGQRMKVEFEGRVIAETQQPVLVYETMLPVRAYFPRSDVDFSLLEPSDRQSICPYKGHASYWSVRNAGPKGRNIAWSYEEPLPDANPIKGLIAFYDERTDIHNLG